MAFKNSAPGGGGPAGADPPERARGTHAIRPFGCLGNWGRRTTPLFLLWPRACDKINTGTVQYVHSQRAPGGNHKFSGIFRPPKATGGTHCQILKLQIKINVTDPYPSDFGPPGSGSDLFLCLYDEKTSFLQYIPVLRIRDKHPGSRIRIFRLQIPDLGSKRSRITNPRIYVFLFLNSRKSDLGGCSFRIPDPDPQTLVHSLT